MSTLPALIGLGGRLRSGKDEVADHLVTTHGYVKVGMSDPLQQALLALDPLIELTYDDGNYASYDYTVRYSEYVAEHGYTEAKQHAEVRRLLQTLGTEVGRNILGPQVWVEAAVKRIYDLHLQGHRHVVLTGIRFQNELDMVRNLGGTAWWVERPEYPETAEEAYDSLDDRLAITYGGRRNGKSTAAHQWVPNAVTEAVVQQWSQGGPISAHAESLLERDELQNPRSQRPTAPTPPHNLRQASGAEPSTSHEKPLDDPGVPGGPEIASTVPCSPSQRAHASESTLSDDDFDLTVVNNGTLDDLYEAIEQVLR